MCACCAAVRREFGGAIFDLLELKNPSTSTKEGFAGSDGIHRRMDVVRTFSPGPRLVCVPLKLAFAAWAAAIVASSIMNKDHPSFWLAYVTNWGLVGTLAYFLLSGVTAAYLAVCPPVDPGALGGAAGAMIKATWGLFATMLPAEILITLLYWTLEFNGRFSYVKVMGHGGLLAVIAIDALLLGRVPLRAKQFWFPQIFCFLYFLWTIIHAYAGIGNPENDGVDQTDDAIYPSMQWKNDTVKAVIMMVGVLFVGNPIIFFLICRPASRLLPRRYCDEEDRRFQADEQSYVEEEGGEAVVY
ncbi:hypothetical protein ACHAWF_009083 [Thalassiosira exigua]